MLKQLLLRKKLEKAKADIEAHRTKKDDLDARAAALDKRSKDCEAALGELTPQSTDEERSAVEDETNKIEAEQNTLTADVAAHNAEEQRLSQAVTDIENEIAELDERSGAAGTGTGVGAETGAATTTPAAAQAQRARKDSKNMPIFNRKRYFGMNREERTAFFAGEEVRSFVSAVRESCKTRSVSGGTLTIPVVILDLLRDHMEEYSKLYAFVNVQHVRGTARQNILGVPPEGIWMEATGELNELDLSLNQVTVDGYLVGGFIPIHNVFIDDSDVNLGAEIVIQLGKAIGKGVDRAILFGTGVKMPVGIATRLAQTSQPSGWGANAPAWTDLHTSNVKNLNIDSTTGAAFYASLIAALGAAKPDYSDGSVFWVVNRATHIKLMCKALAFDAAAALVAGVKGTMPIIGGTIIESEMMENNSILGGFGSLYLLAEREGATIESSEHVRFLQNQTVFKGCARFDGLPVFGEGFVLVNFANTNPETSDTFPEDVANKTLGVLGVTAAAGTEVGDTVLTVTGTAASGTTLAYKIGRAAVKYGQKCTTGWTALTSGTTQITADAGADITVVELDASNKAVKADVVNAVPKA